MILNKFEKHQRIFLFCIIIVSAIALLDIVSMNSGIFGTVAQYTTGNFGMNWWSLFFTFNLIMIILLSLAYYWFRNPDLSEAFSLVAGSILIWFTGLSDILFFWFRGISVPSTLPWLVGSPIFKIVMNTINIMVVTDTFLYILSLAGLVVSYFFIKILVKKF